MKIHFFFLPKECLAPSIHSKCITVNANFVWFYKPMDTSKLFSAQISSLSHAINKGQVISNQQDCFKSLCFLKSWGEALSMVLGWERLSCGAELQLMSERQRSIIGPVCACGGETVLCLCGLRLCLASLAGGRGRSIRASCFDTAQKRLWLWLLQSEHCPTVYHHTWQGKADHTASHTQTHITNLQRVLSLLLSFGRPWGLY